MLAALSACTALPQLQKGELRAPAVHAASAGAAPVGNAQQVVDGGNSKAVSNTAVTRLADDTQARLAKHVSQQDAVVVEYLDSHLHRRCLHCVPVIGKEEADFTVRLSCFVKEQCIARIQNLYGLITKKTQRVASCEMPMHARVAIHPVAGKYGPSVDYTPEVYDIDHTGLCVTRGDQSYRIEKNVLSFLHMSAIQEW